MKPGMYNLNILQVNCTNFSSLKLKHVSSMTYNDINQLILLNLSESSCLEDPEVYLFSIINTLQCRFYAEIQIAILRPIGTTFSYDDVMQVTVGHR